MKIYCEPCKGSGQVTQVMSRSESLRGVRQSRTRECLQCDGKGYTESPQTQRLIELGKAVEVAFEEAEIFDIHEFSAINELLEWYREQERK